MAEGSKVFKESAVAVVYDELKPIEAEFLLGDWTGGDLDTGHAAHKALADMRWAGKCFHSVDNVDPVMVYDEQNNRVWNETYGHAVVSACSTGPYLLPAVLTKSAEGGQIPWRCLHSHDL